MGKLASSGRVGSVTARSAGRTGAHGGGGRRPARRGARPSSRPVWSVVCVRALADTGSPAPTGKIVLRVGLVNEPDNLNPFIGYVDLVVPDLPPELRHAHRLQGERRHPDARAGHELEPQRRRQDLDLQAAARASSGRTACRSPPATWSSPTTTSSRNQHGRLHELHGRHHGGGRGRRLHGALRLHKPKANMLGHGRAHPARSTSGRKISPKAAARTRSRTRRRSSAPGPFQIVEWKKGDYIAHGGQQALLARRAARSTRSSSSTTRTPTRWSRTCKSAARIDACWGIPEAQITPLEQDHDFKAIVYVGQRLRRAGLQLLRGPTSLGNPVLKDWRFRQALHWAIDRKQDRADRLRRLRDRRRRTIMVRATTSDPDWHWQPPADQAYTFDLAKATPDAGRRRLPDGRTACASTSRASRSPCACSPASAPPQGQTASASCWPAALGDDRHRRHVSHMDEGAMNDYLYNTVGGEFVPNMDLFVYNWTGDVDPDVHPLDLPHQPDQRLERLRLVERRPTTPLHRAGGRPSTRQRAGHPRAACSSSSTSRAPYVILAYPQGLEAVDTSRWTGWVQSPAGDGLGDLLDRQHRQLPLRAPGERRQRRRDRQVERAADHLRGHGGDRGRADRDRAHAAAPAAAG